LFGLPWEHGERYDALFALEWLSLIHDERICFAFSNIVDPDHAIVFEPLRVETLPRQVRIRNTKRVRVGGGDHENIPDVWMKILKWPSFDLVE
jgi:hypothetical protein